MGVATGTFGGLMRDVVTNEIPLVLRQGELYLSACLAGALLSILLLRLYPEGETLSPLTAAVATFVLRAGSLCYGWRLPVYRPRAPRNQDRMSTIAEIAGRFDISDRAGADSPMPQSPAPIHLRTIAARWRDRYAQGRRAGLAV